MSKEKHFIRSGLGRGEWFIDELGRYKVEITEVKWVTNDAFTFRGIFGDHWVAKRGTKRITVDGKIQRLDGFYIEPKEER